MDTQLYHINNTQQTGQLKQAGEVILNGGLVAFPTETVYGLGGDAFNKESARKIYQAKGRPSDNPLIVHIAKWDSIYSLIDREQAKGMLQVAEKLAKQFWPGPLTIILPKAESVPMETTGGLSTVAVRMPDHAVALEFIRNAGGFIAAPSANTSGKPSPTEAHYVMEDMSGRIDIVLDAGAACIGLESTILDLTSKTPCILRPGYVTLEMLQGLLKEVDMDTTIINQASKEKPKAPGMKYRHYAPRADMTIVSGESDKVILYINQEIKGLQSQGKKVGVIATDESKEQYYGDIVKSMGSRIDADCLASNLYRILREYDNEEIDFIFSEAFDIEGIGQAIMNRLIKAAGNRIIEV